MTGSGSDIDTTDRAPAGASVWEHELWTHLTTHMKEEGRLLEEYTAVASKTESAALTYLVHLLIEDEMRHHRIFTELAASLKLEVEMGREPPLVPYMDFAKAGGSALREATEHLIEREQQDARALELLQRQLNDVKDTTLWSLLVDLMQRDTQKHLAILRFAQDHAGRDS
jgi:rubrerythrin